MNALRLPNKNDTKEANIYSVGLNYQ